MTLRSGDNLLVKNIVPDRPGEDDPGPGRRLGLDVGTVRIGVAVSDPDGILATPVATIARTTKRRGPDGEDIDSIVQLARDYSVVEVIVGLPRMLDGSAGSSVKHAQDVGFRVRRRLERDGADVPIRYVDERMTTVMAQSNLHDAGISVREGRSVIDQAAAVEILQTWLDQRARH
ncbi:MULTISPECIES: Holliday junction resolvase RuvX [Corynebacterium]|uniref:Holliday junction resolvase RuvX n=1 Tax=Corynebacterium TaxID=1716 RepID=UPI00195B47F4|nr:MULTISPECIES: Holliday junction resolvase RuvX [Corynebacterium]MDN8623506.1 Holliday junction resolvase RuvX [Corynebacterium kroppenstedtii]QRQ64613.1 Holliday junction resolvase RuvX [Corynebacterium kroppenstedtii]